MNRETAEKWIDAMESGRYRKGRGDYCKGGRHCAVGVLDAEFPDVLTCLLLTGAEQEIIVGINDTTPGFGAVCEYVREHLIEDHAE